MSRSSYTPEYIELAGQYRDIALEAQCKANQNEYFRGYFEKLADEAYGEYKHIMYNIKYHPILFPYM